MGKRSDKPRIDRDKYLTPEPPVRGLIPYLPRGEFTFAEPCAHDGRLARHIEKLTGGRGKGVFLADIEPHAEGVQERDALSLTEDDLAGVDLIITNPPWSRDRKSGYLMHRMIEHFRALRPTWLLYDSDWANNLQAAEHLPYCRRIVPVGRVKWIEDSKYSGKDNCSWHLFGAERANHTEFMPRRVA